MRFHVHSLCISYSCISGPLACGNWELSDFRCLDCSSTKFSNRLIWKDKSRSLYTSHVKSNSDKSYNYILKIKWKLYTRVRSGQGKLEKSGKIRKGFPVTRKSGNIDYSPIVREFEDSWVENQNSSHNPLKQKKSTEIIIIGWWSRSFDRNSV